MSFTTLVFTVMVIGPTQRPQTLTSWLAARCVFHLSYACGHYKKKILGQEIDGITHDCFGCWHSLANLLGAELSPFLVIVSKGDPDSKKMPLSPPPVLKQSIRKFSVCNRSVFAA